MPAPRKTPGKGHGRVGQAGRRARLKVEALEKAIQKWHNVAFSDGEDQSIEDCPLCALYYGRGKKDNCDSDCPILQKVGSREECNDTPWARHQIRVHKQYYPWKRQKGCGSCTRLAREEYNFLVSLRWYDVSK